MDPGPHETSAHLWLDLLHEYQQTILSSPGYKLRKSRGRLKFGILSTGIDLLAAGPRAIVEARRLQNARNFLSDAASDDDVTDTVGVGSAHATMVHRTAPTAGILMAKVTDWNRLDSPTIDAICLAIPWCVEQGADIVVLPFVFPKRVPEIANTIESVHDKAIFIAAASGGQGGNASIVFPASHRNVLAIHSTGGFGNPSSFKASPRARSENFSTLGEALDNSWKIGGRIRSGTSMAACVAGGILTNVLEYAETKINLDSESRIALRSTEGATAVFRLMSASRMGYSYVAPWLLWTDDRDEDDVQAMIKMALKHS